MSATRIYYGQIPVNVNSVCQPQEILTDIFQQMLILYVSRKEFLRTDSSKCHFCMSAHRNSYRQISPQKTGRRESAAHNHKLKTRSQLGTQAAIGFEFTVLS